MWNNGQIVPLGTTVHPIPPPPPSAPSETEADAEARLEEKARKWQQMNSKRYSVRENPGLLRLRKRICLVNMSEKSSGSRCEGLNVIVKFDEVFDQPDPTKALKKLVNPRLGDNYSIDSVFKKLGVIVKPTEKPRLVLKFIWMEKNIGIALDQMVLGHGTIPLSPYHFWPRKDAWEELKELLESKRWISQKQ